MAWRHVQAMLDVGHWQPFQGGKLPYVEGLPGLPPEGITDLLDREHHQVTVRPVAGEPHVAADRHLGVGLAGVGGGRGYQNKNNYLSARLLWTV